MPDVRPDPKPERKKGNRPRRIIDHGAVKTATLRQPECAACGGRTANGHHVLPKDRFGDDLHENIVGLCGSGTTGCHGAHHGSPYVVTLVRLNEEAPGGAELYDERRDAEWVNRRVGRCLIEHRPDTIEYVLDKLGGIPGGWFLMTTYYIEFTPTGWRAIP